MQRSGDITTLLADWREGDSHALERLIPLVYDDLRRVAAGYMRAERPDHTLQATALLHEAFLRLSQESNRSWENRGHFFAMAARIMRNLLIDHARSSARDKRGGGLKHVTLSNVAEAAGTEPNALLALDQTLDRLAQVDPRAGRIVELRYFVGLSNSETGLILGISERTVKREWSAARAWLLKELRKESN